MTKNPIIPAFVVLITATSGRALFFHEINEALFIIAPLVDLSLIIAAVVLIFKALKRIRKSQNPYVAILVAAVTLLGGLAAWPLKGAPMLGTCFRLWRMESVYGRVVERVLAVNDGDYKEFRYPARVDPGPPVRVAFSWGGILDNWHGVVYDPSGQVMKAARFKSDWSNWDDPALAETRGLFGGDMMYARHLWGHWYYCSFT